MTENGNIRHKECPKARKRTGMLKRGKKEITMWFWGTEKNKNFNDCTRPENKGRVNKSKSRCGAEIYGKNYAGITEVEGKK